MAQPQSFFGQSINAGPWVDPSMIDSLKGFSSMGAGPGSIYQNPEMLALRRLMQGGPLQPGINPVQLAQSKTASAIPPEVLKRIGNYAKSQIPETSLTPRGMPGELPMQGLREPMSGMMSQAEKDSLAKVPALMRLLQRSEPALSLGKEAVPSLLPKLAGVAAGVLPLLQGHSGLAVPQNNPSYARLPMVLAQMENQTRQDLGDRLKKLQEQKDGAAASQERGPKHLDVKDLIEVVRDLYQQHVHKAEGNDRGILLTLMGTALRHAFANGVVQNGNRTIRMNTPEGLTLWKAVMMKALGMTPGKQFSGMPKPKIQEGAFE